MLLGLHYNEVKLVKINAVREFNKEKEHLCKILGEVGSGGVEIIHVGSTAMGILTKPIVDIVVSLEDFNKGQDIISILTMNNYRGLAWDISEGWIVMIKNDEEGLTTHHIHIVEKDGHKYNNLENFLRIMKENDNYLKEYEALKIHLAKKYQFDRKSYGREKGVFIERVLKEFDV